MIKLILLVSIALGNLSLGNCAAKFTLYTKSNPTNGFVTTSSNINNSPFSRTAKVYFIVHGYTSSEQTSWYPKIRDNLLSIEDANVFYVDWSAEAAGPDYAATSRRVSTIGGEVSTFITGSGIDRTKIHCIGHSLGAHVCGFAGKGGQLARITGMDPAGPNFRGQPSSVRLDKGDARLVDNIHGDALLGIQDAIGHKDFYPNGGAQQAGCFVIGKRSVDEIFFPAVSKRSIDKRQDITSLLSCSHNRIPDLFAESITSSCAFTSIQCNSYSDYNGGSCKCSTTYGCSSMGFFASRSAEQGKFYLTTNNRTPFCKN